MPLISRILLLISVGFIQIAYGQKTTQEINAGESNIDSLIIKAYSKVQETDYTQTLNYLQHAKELAISIDDKKKLAKTSSIMASVYLLLDEYEKASKESVEAIRIQRELKLNRELGISYLTYAKINLKTNDLTLAKRYFNEAETIFLIEQDKAYLAEVYLGQGNLDMALKNPKAAIEKYGDALDYYNEDQKNSFSRASALLQIAKAYLATENYDAASNNGKRALQLSQSEKFPQIELGSLYLLSGLASRHGNNEHAYELLQKYYDRQGEIQKIEATGKHPILRDAMIAQLDPTSFTPSRRIEANKITTVLIIALFTILCLLALSLYKNNNLRAKANDLLQSKNSELMIAKDNAEKASMVKAQFLSTITHELRTPMYAVTGLTHLLLTEDPTPEQKKHLDSLKFSGEYLLSLINNILDLNKLEANKVEVEYTTFDLKKRADDVIFALERSAQEKGNSLHLEYDTEIPNKIMGDPLMISQILINLIGNSNKFTRDGDIFVRIRKISENETQTYLHFEVEDTGEGISKKKQKNIFQNFTQGSVQINRKFGGTGLGLSIVKRLLDLQNSKIDLESTLGKGSKFFFDLKYTIVKNQDSEAHKEKTYDIDYEALKGKKILVVEDNKINQMITKKILEKNKMQCDVADNGEISIEKARFENYDLILMDIHMPGITGIEATKKIRQFDSKVPILALTAVTIDENIDEFFIAGFNDIIPKPYKVEEFFAKIYKCTKPKDTVES